MQNGTGAGAKIKLIWQKRTPINKMEEFKRRKGSYGPDCKLYKGPDPLRFFLGGNLKFINDEEILEDLKDRRIASVDKLKFSQTFSYLKNHVQSFPLKINCH